MSASASSNAPVTDWDLRVRILTHNRIGLVLDVGANTGQYAGRIREYGYAGRIVSFEPLPEPFDALVGQASREPDWDCHRLALGDRDGLAMLNIAGNSLSSSFLPMRPLHLEAAPDSGYVGQQEVRMARLDSIAPDLGLEGATGVFMKIDVQGAEPLVLAGARDTMSRIAVVELEMSLVPLYEGEPDWRETIDLLEGLGFGLVFLSRDFFDPRTGHVLQVNGIFERKRN